MTLSRSIRGDLLIQVHRPATDLTALNDICVRTADAGQHARGQYFTDDLMPDPFAGPYLHLEPELAFVLADTAGGADRAVDTC